MRCRVDIRKEDLAIESAAGCLILESCRFAPITSKASGTMRRSTTRCRLLPDLPRSVGFGPVRSPRGKTRAIDARPAPIDLIVLANMPQQRMRQPPPHARALPQLQALPACHSAAV